MSALSKQEIINGIEQGRIAFTPQLDKFQLQSHAVDMRIGYTFMLPRTWHMTANGRESLNVSYLEDKIAKNNFEVIELERGQYFELLPGEYVIASTLEKIKVPEDLMAVLYPRSSTNRRGLSIDLTGIIDAGYEGQLTLPIKNNTRSQVIRLYPGERFCQVVFETLSTTTEVRKSRYHQKDVIEGFLKHNKEAGTESDDDVEIDLILSGDIKKLKTDYKI